MNRALGNRTPVKILVTQSTDHITGLTGQAANVLANLKVSKGAVAFGAAAGTMTEGVDGFYLYVPTVGEVDTAGEWAWSVAPFAGADPVAGKFGIYDLGVGSITPAAIQQIMDSPNSGMTTVNSFGKAVLDTVIAVSTVLSDVDDTSGGGIQTVMDAITTLLARITAQVGTKLANLAVNAGTGAVVADLDVADAIGAGITQRMALRAIFAAAGVGGQRTGFDGTTNPNVFHVKALTGGQPDAFTGTADVNGNITAAAWNLGVLADNTKW